MLFIEQNKNALWISNTNVKSCELPVIFPTRAIVNKLVSFSPYKGCLQPRVHIRAMNFSLLMVIMVMWIHISIPEEGTWHRGGELTLDPFTVLSQWTSQTEMIIEVSLAGFYFIYFLSTFDDHIRVAGLPNILLGLWARLTNMGRRHHSWWDHLLWSEKCWSLCLGLESYCCLQLTGLCTTGVFWPACTPIASWCSNYSL